MFEVRPLTHADIKAVKRIDHDSFGYESYGAGHLQNVILDHIFYNDYRNATYSIVAVEDGQIMGVLLGECDDDARVAHRLLCNLRLGIDTLLLLPWRIGKAYLRDNRLTSMGDSDMKRRANRKYRNELILIAVGSAYKRKGIGRAMLNVFHAYLNDHGQRRYYLFTDVYCDKDYYRHMGYELVVETTVQYGNGPASGFYMYEKDL